MKRKKERDRAKRRDERRAERDIDDEEELRKTKRKKITLGGVPLVNTPDIAKCEYPTRHNVKAF